MPRKPSSPKPAPKPRTGKSSAPAPPEPPDPLSLFHPITAAWFRAVFDQPTPPQRDGWPAIARGESTLILAPTGTGKTLTAFLWCLNKLMLGEDAASKRAINPGTRVIYISPLKALAVDVERNLRSPLAGIANMAQQSGVSVHIPEISVRTGDTPQKERARFRRHAGEILITTPESLYLLLTSDASEALRHVETVIIDEIHALVPTKRGAHLALSIERLEALVRTSGNPPLQRIGLSATQRPLEEVARFLGGATPISQNPGAPSLSTAPSSTRVGENNPEPALLTLDTLDATDSPTANQQSGTSNSPSFRPVTIVNAGARKPLELRVEVPVEDMARLGEIEDLPSGPASQGPKRTSIWQSIHPRLLEIIRERTSTLIFVNARRVAERLAGALNDLAGEPLARAHHGSLAAAQRVEIEELLKAGKIKALVATSSLELGIDMGAIDLVIQIEAPPSVASGMQRIGRAGHQVGAPSNGIIFPKYRADLVACAAVTQAMHEGHVESTRFLRNPLDVLAQQLVATVSQPPLPGAPSLSTASSSTRVGLRTATEDEPGPGISRTALFDLVRSSAPFATLTAASFDGVLDMLAGRYPSDEFAELRPRITWDRNRDWLTPRQGVKRIAILNGGTIPDRGLYGVFLAGAHAKPIRVGELDEEMVFESRTGDTFILGASTWRIEEITHDRVLVSPAPGDPGKMPFWHGDRAGRPMEFGRRIGSLVRQLRDMPRALAVTSLVKDHDLDTLAAENLMRYLADQEIATTVIPDDRTVVIERVRDELGDWRVCVLTPFGSRIHIPWAMAATAKLHAIGGPAVETMWSEDGFVLRFPETDSAPDIEPLLLEPAEAAELILQQLGSTSLFAAKFRESASRALLLPRRRAEGRTPLWQQRKRAYDLLSVASRYASFPILLEAYRECLRDVFDMPALQEILRNIQQRSLRVHTVDSRTPSPFASALLFSYVANYIYDGDAPLAERRAQALSIDQDQLRELLGDADLRELLDLTAIEETEEQLQSLTEGYKARNLDGVHDLLLRLGDLTREELFARFQSPQSGAPGLNSETRDSASHGSGAPSLSTASSSTRVGENQAKLNTEPGAPFVTTKSSRVGDESDAAAPLDRILAKLLRARRALEITVASQKRFIAVEDSARYRDALGVPLPPGLPSAFLEPAPEAATDLLRRYARTHGPFTTAEATRRFGLPIATVESTLERLLPTGRVVEGGFRPGGVHREWCDAEVLRTIRRKSLARLRKEVEPVEQRVLARLFTRWQGVVQPRRGLDALLDVVENLQGAPLPASILETEILPARIRNYRPEDLDTLIAAGEVTWAGLDPIGERDGRIALYLADKITTLWPVTPTSGAPGLDSETRVSTSDRESQITAYLRSHGASFFQQIHDALGGGYPGETLEALWNLVWRGLLTNDSFHALRAYTSRPTASAKHAKRVHQQGPGFRSRRTTPPTAQGRWSLNPAALDDARSATQWSHAMAQQLLTRYGVVFRETAHAEGLTGGFSAIYDVLKALEESGRVRRGYFAADLGAAQFAMPAAVDLLRSLRTECQGDTCEMLLLAATDPANPYGALLRWPTRSSEPGAPGLDSETRDSASHGSGAPSLSTASSSARVGENQAKLTTDPGAPFVTTKSARVGDVPSTTLTRSVGARVALCDGALVAYLRRGNPNLQVFLPEDDPARTNVARALAEFLVSRIRSDRADDPDHRAGLLISTVNGVPVAETPLARPLLDAGFIAGAMGYNVRRLPTPAPNTAPRDLHPS